MIKNIFTSPRYEIRLLIESVRRLKTDLPWYLISIYEGIKDKCVVGEMDREILRIKGCVDVLELDFSDVTDKQYHKIINEYPEMKSKVKLFSNEQANKIVLFLKDVNKKNDGMLIAQCGAGISRSGAVGIFACRFLGIDEKIFRTNNSLINPNPYVYDLLYRVSGMRDDYVRFWEEKIPIDAQHMF